MSFVSHTGANGVDYYINAEGGLQVVVPGTGSIKLDDAATKKLVNFFNQFDFIKATSDYRRAANGAGKPITTFFESGDGMNKRISIFNMMILDRYGKVVESTIKTVSVATGSILNIVTVSSNTMTKILEELAKQGVTSKLRQFTDVKYVEALPDETGLSSKNFYKVNGTVFKLNEAQDAFEEVTEKIVSAKTLPPTELDVKEDVLYFLTTANRADYAKPGPDRGFYEYKAAKKSFMKADYVGLTELSRLPKKDEEIEDNMVYITTQDIAQGKDQDPIKKGTVYVGKSGALGDPKPLKIKQVDVLPSLEVAEADHIYEVNGVYRKFADGKYGEILATGLVELAEKPDFAKVEVTVDPEIIYVLTRDVDAKHKFGTRWVWNATSKEFKAYDPEELAPTPAAKPAATGTPVSSTGR